MRADGKLAIPGVPRGKYLLRVGDALHEFTASEIDLSAVVATRPDLAYDSGASQVALTVTGMHPFRQGGFFTGDFFEITSAQADVFSRPFQLNTHGVRPPEGATSFSGTITWGDHSGGTPVGLPDASKNDVLYASNGPHMDLGSGDPTLTWSAPSLGFATGYIVTLVDASVFFPFVATAFVREPRFHVPEGLLTSGGTYYAKIQAFAAPWDRPDAPLYRFGYPEYFADCVTAGFSP